MSHWNHRVFREVLFNGKDWYTVREVFYNKDGSIYAHTEEPVDISGESVEGIREYVEWILDCLDKSVLVVGKVEFVDPEEE